MQITEGKLDNSTVSVKSNEFQVPVLLLFIHKYLKQNRNTPLGEDVP